LPLTNKFKEYLEPHYIIPDNVFIGTFDGGDIKVYVKDYGNSHIRIYSDKILDGDFVRTYF